MEKIMKLAALMAEADKLAKELIEEGRESDTDFQVLSARLSNGEMEIHIYHNLKALAEKLGVECVRANRADDTFPFEDSVTIDGVKICEILTKEEAADDASVAV